MSVLLKGKVPTTAGLGTCVQCPKDRGNNGMRMVVVPQSTALSGLRPDLDGWSNCSPQVPLQD